MEILLSILFLFFLILYLIWKGISTIFQRRRFFKETREIIKETLKDDDNISISYKYFCERLRLLSSYGESSIKFGHPKDFQEKDVPYIVNSYNQTVFFYPKVCVIYCANGEVRREPWTAYGLSVTPVVSKYFAHHVGTIKNPNEPFETIEEHDRRMEELRREREQQRIDLINAQRTKIARYVVEKQRCTQKDLQLEFKLSSSEVVSQIKWLEDCYVVESAPGNRKKVIIPNEEQLKAILTMKGFWKVYE